MSASALLSVLTGGAPNGASGAPVANAPTGAAADMGVTGFPSFSRLLDAEGQVIEVSENGEPSPVGKTYAYAPLVHGIPLTLEATTVQVEEIVQADIVAVAATQPDARAEANLAGKVSAPANSAEQSRPEDLAEDAASIADEQPVPVTVTAPILFQPVATAKNQANASTTSAGMKAADLAAAFLASPTGDETQEPPSLEAEPKLETKTTELPSQSVRDTATSQQGAAQPHPAIARLQSSAFKTASQSRNEARDALAQIDKASESSATKASTEASSSHAPKPVVTHDTPSAQLSAADDATVQALTNDTAPQDSEAQSSEPVEQLQAEGRTTDNTRLSRATVETTAQIAASILRKLEGRTTRFDMVLTPEDLGSVDVSMEIDAEGHMTARLAFDSPAASAEMRLRAEELRRQLIESGFQLSENALEFTDRGNDPRGGFQQFMSDERSNRRAFAGGNRLAAEADTPVAPVWTSVTLSPSGVDMKV